jgi:hypothetical protein
MNITNVPFVTSGANIAGAKGEILCYAINNIGTVANPNWRLTQWNSSKVFGGASGTAVGSWYSGTVNASLPSCYDWNISLPLINSGAWTINRYVVLDNLLLLQQGSLGTGPRDNGFGANITAVSLNPNSIGNILWTKFYAPAPDNVTRKIIAVDPVVGVFVTEDKETLRFTGFSLTAVDPAAPTQSPQTQISLPPTEMYTIGVGIAIIIAIAIVGAILLMAIKKRP